MGTWSETLNEGNAGIFRTMHHGDKLVANRLVCVKVMWQRCLFKQACSGTNIDTEAQLIGRSYSFTLCPPPATCLFCEMWGLEGGDYEVLWTKMHGVTSQNTVIFMFTSLRLKFRHCIGNVMFSWPCISIYACNETNLMHYLSVVYSVIIPLHISGLLVAHHQEVTIYLSLLFIVIYFYSFLFLFIHKII
jgi:hypothetical protein